MSRPMRHTLRVTNPPFTIMWHPKENLHGCMSSRWSMCFYSQASCIHTIVLFLNQWTIVRLQLHFHWAHPYLYSINTKVSFVAMMLSFWTVYTGSPCYSHLENGIKSELAVAARTWYIYWHASQLAGERTVVNTSDNSPYTGTLACIMSDPGCCRMASDLQLTKSMMPLADSSAPEMGMLPCLRCLMTHGGWGASAQHGVDG
jgi:hypothetical protein